MSVEIKDVVKRVSGETHIYKTSLGLADKGFNVLLGATGSGKTTLIKLLAGLEKPTSGEVWIKGRNVTRVDTQRRKISLVHQFFVNYPTMSVYENIASPLKVAGIKGEERDRRVREAADILKLTPMLRRRPSELSGGQQQRTALARAIVKEADLVLLDEPLANLDYKLREELRDELPRLFAGRGATVVYATSEPTEALLLGGHTATMQEGRVIQFGPTAEIYRTPSQLSSAQVFSDPPINVAEVTKSDGRIIMDGGVTWNASGAISGAPDGTYTIGVRPHFVSPRSESEDMVVLSGKVLITELSGSESVAHFAVGDRVWVSQSQGVYPFAVGETHTFYLDAGSCLYFDDQGRLVV